jgi:coproporphyrinogen III oxidase-like Fe-S oxidoreductase
MRLMTLARDPRDVPALAALGARDVLVRLPSRPSSAPRVADFVREVVKVKASVTLVLGDVVKVPDLTEWDNAEGREVLSHPDVSLLARRLDTLDIVRRLAPQARLSIGPWPRDDASMQRMRELDVGCVWSGQWKDWASLRSWLDAAHSEGFNTVVPVARSVFVSAAQDASLDWEQLVSMFSRAGSSWAFAVRDDTELEGRCGELMEVKTLLSTKSAIPLDAVGPVDPALPYAQTEGFPQLYAELIRHPPAIELAPERASTAMRLTETAWEHAPSLLSVYVHVPFCVKRCGFCFCSSHGVRGEDAKRLRACVDAICAETDMWAHAPLLRDRVFNTFYMGGGSPSALPPAQLTRVIEHVLKAFHFVEAPVVSIEMAPSSTSVGKLEAAKRAGANRLSFGAQSFSDDTLHRIGSAHDRKLLLRALHSARDAGFADVDIDLLFGIPGQTIEDLLRDIDDGIEAGVSSMMLFPFTLTPSLLSWWARQGWPCQVWTARRYHDFWDCADRHLTEAGFARFGYSHYKRELGRDTAGGETISDKFFSRYLYVMPGSDGQVAIGPTAVGCVANQQYENVCSIDDYNQIVAHGHLPVGRMTPPAEAWPALVWWVIEQSASPGFVDLSAVTRRFGDDACERVDALLNPLAQRGLFERVNGGFRTTRLGTIWMANVQSELLRTAKLPSPVGHLIRP